MSVNNNRDINMTKLMLIEVAQLMLVDAVQLLYKHQGVTILMFPHHKVVLDISFLPWDESGQLMSILI